MTVIRNNTKQDDGTDSITGVNWFTFNGTTASTVYASGNSWIGFGSSNEHLKVNRIDGAMWYLYREEGTLYNYYKFLKIRWSGYSKYNQTSSAYKVEYDVILWDTGDISLHMISIPTSNNTGTYSFVASSTYTYTVSASSPDITFKKTDGGYEVQNNIINIDVPWETRYLIRDGATIYTVVDGALSSLGNVEATSTLFLNFGVKDTPSMPTLIGLTNPELLYWTDLGPDLTTGLTLTGMPPMPQVMFYDEQTIPDGSAIKMLESKSTFDALFTVTFDGGATWNYYDTVSQSWFVAATESEGMKTATLKAIIPEQWANVATSTTYQVRGALLSPETSIGKLLIAYT